MKRLRLFSFNLSADFATFRKFDTADSIYLTYYFIPRPTIIGILASIVGIKKSEKNNLPWWESFKDIKIALEPLNINPIKHLVIYNNSTGTANYKKIGKGADKKKTGQNLIIREQILLDPEYRIYVEINDKTEPILELLRSRKSIFTLYLGKNEFRAEISQLNEYEGIPFNGKNKISSIYPSFLKDATNSRSIFSSNIGNDIQIIESHPYSYDDNLNYKQTPFCFSSDEINTLTIDTGSIIKGTFIELKEFNKTIYLYGE